MGTDEYPGGKVLCYNACERRGGSNGYAKHGDYVRRSTLTQMRSHKALPFGERNRVGRAKHLDKRPVPTRNETARRCHDRSRYQDW